MARQQGSDRGDVLLARQFSGEALDAGADEVWDTLKVGALDHVRTVRWGGPSAIEATLIAELVSGLALAGSMDETGFEMSLGGTIYENNVYFWAARALGGRAAQPLPRMLGRSYRLYVRACPVSTR